MFRLQPSKHSTQTHPYTKRFLNLTWFFTSQWKWKSFRQQKHLSNCLTWLLVISARCLRSIIIKGILSLQPLNHLLAPQQCAAVIHCKRFSSPILSHHHVTMKANKAKSPSEFCTQKQKATTEKTKFKLIKPSLDVSWNVSIAQSRKHSQSKYLFWNSINHKKFRKLYLLNDLRKLSELTKFLGLIMKWIYWQKSWLQIACKS